MKGIYILVFVGFLMYSNAAQAQSKDSSYYKGNLQLIKKTTRKIMRKFSPESDSAYGILAVIEINTKGKLENLLVTTFKNSNSADIIYNILLETRNEWVNNTNSNLYFELPIYIIHVYDNNKEDAVPFITTMQYNEDKMASYIMLDPIYDKIYPTVR